MNFNLRVVVAALVAAGAIGLAGCEPAESQQAVDTITWSHPTQREDNTPLALSEIKETLIAWGPSGGPYTAGSKTVTAPAATTTVPSLSAGTRCYVGFTVDTALRVSAASVQACKTIVAPPKSPSNLGVS